MPTISLRRIFSLSTIYGLTPVLDRAMGLLLLPVYTHYLDTTQYGSMVLFYTFAFIVRLAAYMGFPDSLQKLVWDYQGRELKRFLGSIWLFNLGVNLAMLSALAAFSGPISLFLLKNGSLSFLLVLVVVNVFLGTQSIIPYVLFRAREQRKQILAYNLTSVLVRVGATVLFLIVLKMGLVAIFLADIAASMAVLVFTLPNVFRSIEIRFDLGYVRTIFRLSAFQLVIELFAWVLSLSDRFLIQKLINSTAEVGIYAVGYTFGSALNFLTVPVLSAWTPYAFSVNARSRKEYAAQMGEFLPVFLIACGTAMLMLLAVSPDLIRLLTPPQYHRAGGLVLIILAGHVCAMMSNYFLSPFFIEKKLYWVSLAYAVAAASNIAVNLYLLPRIGITGAAWATLTAYALLLALMYLISLGLIRINVSLGTVAMVVAFFAVSVGALSLVSSTRPMISLLYRSLAAMPFLLATLAFVYKKRKALLPAGN